MKFRNNKQKLTRKELEDFEEVYDLKLPKLYKDIVLMYNGGYPEKRYYKGLEIYFYPINYGRNILEKILNTSHEDYIPEKFFPFGKSSGRLLCIDLNKEYYGTIYTLDEEGNYNDIADSLEELMEGLSDNSDY